jgi:hypothetical protein
MKRRSRSVIFNFRDPCLSIFKEGQDLKFIKTIKFIKKKICSFIFKCDSTKNYTAVHGTSNIISSFVWIFCLIKYGLTLHLVGFYILWAIQLFNFIHHQTIKPFFVYNKICNNYQDNSFHITFTYLQGLLQYASISKAYNEEKLFLFFNCFTFE